MFSTNVGITQSKLLFLTASRKKKTKLQTVKDRFTLDVFGNVISSAFLLLFSLDWWYTVSQTEKLMFLNLRLKGDGEGSAIIMNNITY